MFRHPNLKHSDGTTDDFAFNKKIDQSIRYFQVPAMKDKEDVLNLLLDKIDHPEKKQSKAGKVRQLYYTVSSVAAIGIILIAAYFFLSFETFTGQQNTANVFYLPDNSRVVLTDGAQLKYSKWFYKRNVKLKGEAYFEVEKGSGFYVDTNQGGVLVLGTRFSVKDLDASFEVHCYQGIVGVDYYNQKVKLNAGMHFSGKNQTFDVVTDKNIGYPLYAQFNQQYRNTNIESIWPDVEAYFGVEIVDEVEANKNFTGAINTGDMHEVMDIVCTSMGLEFVAEKDKIIVKQNSNS